MIWDESKGVGEDVFTQNDELNKNAIPRIHRISRVIWVKGLVVSYTNKLPDVQVRMWVSNINLVPIKGFFHSKTVWDYVHGRLAEIPVWTFVLRRSACPPLKPIHAYEPASK